MPDFEPISSQCHRDFSPSDRVLVSQHCYKGRPPLAAALYKPMDAHRMVKFKMFLKLLYRILKLPAFQNACMLIKTHHSFSVVQMYLSFILCAVARHRVTECILALVGGMHDRHEYRSLRLNGDIEGIKCHALFLRLDTSPHISI